MSSQNQATFIEGHVLRRFTILKKIGSGAYGHVWKVQDKQSKKIYALKKIFDAFQHSTDAQRTYREIQVLKQTEHQNIIKLYETIKADNKNDIYLVFQFMEADLHNVISQSILKEVHIKFITYQLAKALKYLHSCCIIHRDLKPSNILINSNCAIKLCDFGLVRSLVGTSDSGPVLTEGVATRWYRAPQVLLGSKTYSTPADIWSFGCIIYQILQQKPLFAGNSTLEQVQKICSFTGYPSEEDLQSIDSEMSQSVMKEIKAPNSNMASFYLKGLAPQFADLIQQMIVFNPKKRITIDSILAHQLVKVFNKPQEETIAHRIIKTQIDDNIKYSVDEYRRLIYGEPSKSVLASNSSKQLKKPSILASKNSQLSKTFGLSDKNDFQKQYSYEKFKSTHIISDHNNAQKIGKKPEKQTLKYVRSAKEFAVCHQLRSSSGNNDRRANQTRIKVEDAQQLEHPSISKTFYSPKNYMEQKKSSSTHANSSLTALSPKIVVNKDLLKQKSYLFKSPKYISRNVKNEGKVTNESTKIT